MRNQMGKESARPQALLYVVSKFCASAIWPFSEGFAPPRLGQVLQEREAYILGYHALQRFCPRNRTKSARNGGIAPPLGVASSWVLHFHGVASGGYPCFLGTLALRVSLCSLLVGAFPLLCALGNSLCRLAVCSTTPHILAAAREQRFPQAPSVQELPPIVVVVGSLMNRPDVWK